MSPGSLPPKLHSADLRKRELLAVEKNIADPQTLSAACIRKVPMPAQLRLLPLRVAMSGLGAMPRSRTFRRADLPYAVDRISIKTIL